MCYQHTVYSCQQLAEGCFLCALPEERHRKHIFSSTQQPIGSSPYTFYPHSNAIFRIMCDELLFLTRETLFQRQQETRVTSSKEHHESWWGLFVTTQTKLNNLLQIHVRGTHRFTQVLCRWLATSRLQLGWQACRQHLMIKAVADLLISVVSLTGSGGGSENGTSFKHRDKLAKSNNDGGGGGNDHF